MCSKLNSPLAAGCPRIVNHSGMASTASATHSWGGYHWARTANPFTIKLGNNVSGA